jgi:hypothetical protein
MVMDIREISGRRAGSLSDIGRWIVPLVGGGSRVVVGFYADALKLAGLQLRSAG